LFDVAENTDLRHTNMQMSRTNGHAVHRMPPRRFDLRYMVSALSTVIEDEHLLLWRTLITLLKYQHFPVDLLPDSLRSLEPPLTTKILKAEEGPRLLDLWSAFDTPPHPALLYVVTVPVDLEIAIESPLVLTRTVRYVRSTAQQEVIEPIHHIGGTVRDRQGIPLAGVRVASEDRVTEESITNSEGKFVLANLRPGQATLRVLSSSGVPKLVKVEIPSDSYDLTLD
jgi:hypothetical protein